jgi:hypothetical protein
VLLCPARGYGRGRVACIAQVKTIVPQHPYASLPRPPHDVRGVRRQHEANRRQQVGTVAQAFLQLLYVAPPIWLVEYKSVSCGEGEWCEAGMVEEFFEEGV